MDQRSDFFQRQLEGDKLTDFLNSVDSTEGGKASLLKDVGAQRRRWLYEPDPEAGEIVYEELAGYQAGRLNAADGEALQFAVLGDPSIQRELDAVSRGLSAAAEVSDRAFAPASQGIARSWIPSAAAIAAVALGSALYYSLSKGPNLDKVATKAPEVVSAPAKQAEAEANADKAIKAEKLKEIELQKVAPSKSESDWVSSSKVTAPASSASSVSDIAKGGKWGPDKSERLEVDRAENEPTSAKSDSTSVIPPPDAAGGAMRSAVEPGDTKAEKVDPPKKESISTIPAKPANQEAKYVPLVSQGNGKLSGIANSMRPNRSGSAGRAVPFPSGVAKSSGYSKVQKVRTPVGKKGYPRFVMVKGFKKRVVWRTVRGVIQPGYIQWRGHTKRWYPLRRRSLRKLSTTSANSQANTPVEISTSSSTSGQVIVEQDEDVEISNEALDMYKARVEEMSTTADKASLQSPIQAHVVEDQPLLRWEAVPGAKRYRVDLERLESEGPVRQFSANTDGTETRPSEPLLRGRRYRWNVVAMTDSGEVPVTSRSGKQAEFYLVPSEAKEKLDVSKTSGPSLRHAAALARAGLFEEAIEEVNACQRIHPSAAAERLQERIKRAIAIRAASL